MKHGCRLGLDCIALDWTQRGGSTAWSWRLRRASRGWVDVFICLFFFHSLSFSVKRCGHLSLPLPLYLLSKQAHVITGVAENGVVFFTLAVPIALSSSLVSWTTWSVGHCFFVFFVVRRYHINTRIHTSLGVRRLLRPP